MAGILTEIDTKQTSTVSSNVSISSGEKTQTSSSSNVKFNEAASVKEYMQSFSRNIKKKEEVKKDGNSSDEEMIERILKPETNQKSILDRKPVVIIEESTECIEISPAEPEISPEEPEIQNKTLLDDSDDDMDYSMLDDIEKQIEIPEPIVKETKTHKWDEDLDKHFLTGWDNIGVMDNAEDELLNSTQKMDVDDTNMKIWYWDAWEDQYKRPGQIYLFGKVPANKQTTGFQSVCVHIENVEKCIYLLPREFIWDSVTRTETAESVTLNDVYNEFVNTIASELKITTYRSKPVTKNFAATVPGVNVPETCEYIEVRYDGKAPILNLTKKYKTISHIFGANSTSLESFLLECKIKGPCWLNIKNFKINENPFSWCKLELVCPSIKSIQVSDETNKRKQSPPELSVVTLNVRTAINPKTTKNEVVMISCLVNNKFALDKPAPSPPFNRHFCGFTRPISTNWPLDFNQKLSGFISTKTTKLDSERALLSWFLATFQNIDADLVVTHDANDCQLDVICDRIVAIKIPMWSRIGRLKITVATGKRFKDFFIGRMVCDVKASAEELIKSRSYDLDALCTNVLKIKEGERKDISNDDLLSMFETSDGILKLIAMTMQDCSYIMRLMCDLNILPLALQITNICGNIMSRTLLGGRSERNEFLLLHAFTDKNYIVPDRKIKESNNLSTGREKKKAAYAGGLVLEPQKGFYDKYILLMDFNSLYPSIIQEYNICYTTVAEPIGDSEPVLPDPSIEQGVLPRQIRRLVESRREVKKLMANPDLEPEQRMQYNIRQLALKLTANSMYGCLGFSNSRFFAQHLAALTTLKGREILENTKSMVQKMNFDVIYGDTDSIMINTNIQDYDQVYKIGHQIKQAVNKMYRQVELEIDGVFKCLLLLKKKKYAAVTISKSKKGEFTYTQEHKGLDIVRRDWSQISVMAGTVILNEILSENLLEEKVESIHEHLKKFKNNISDNSVPLPLLTVTKQLTKDPKDYPDQKSQAHVQVALRMNATKNKRFKRGDMISYIICEDGTSNPAMQRSYHLDELKGSETLKIDTQYYLAHQIHPVVTRLCEHLEGTDSSQIAICLGLDGEKYKLASQKAIERTNEVAGEAIVKTTVEKYKNCEKFKFKCPTCKTECTVAAAFKRIDANLVPVLERCVNPDCNVSPFHYVPAIKNEMILAIRRSIKLFYENRMICDNESCGGMTRIYTHVANAHRPICHICKEGSLYRQYTEKELYDQLLYYRYIFDLKKYDKKCKFIFI